MSKDDNDILQEEGRDGLDPMAELVPLYPSGIAEHVEALKQCRIAQFYDAATARMFDRAEGRERPLILPWPETNDALGGGLWPGLHVLVGNTGSGKSQWSLQVALHAARSREVPVLYLGLELGQTDLVARLLGLISRQRWSDLYLGTSEARLRKAVHFGSELPALPFYLDVASPMGWDYSALYERAKAMRHLHPKGPLLIVLDYLQLVAGEGRDLRERIGRASYQARAAARDFDAVVLLLSSTARENYAGLSGEDGQTLGEGSTARFVGLGKEAGEIEYAADSVLVLAAEPLKDEEKRPPVRRVFLAIAKVRAGRPGWVTLAFNGNRFFSRSQQEQLEKEEDSGVMW